MSHYLAALCEGCERVTLVALDAFGSSKLCCESCKTALRVVPSCSYARADFELFDELSQTVADGGVTPHEARMLTGEVARALALDSFKACSETLAVRLPGLLPFQLVTGSNVAVHRKAIQMLRTIFDALASLRRDSAIRVVPAAVREARRLA